jgi:general secretion pathway protein G
MAKPTAAGEAKPFSPTTLEQRADQIHRLLGNSRGPAAKYLRDPRAPGQSELRAWGERSESAAAANRRLAPNADSGESRGFTLLELMIVMAIIAILVSISIPIYGRSVVAAHERALRADLVSLRSAIWNYTLDKQKAPQSLDDLVTAQYLPQLPKDPMTHETNWEVVEDETLLSVNQQDPGITDVHSASTATASDGTSYNTW